MRHREMRMTGDGRAEVGRTLAALGIMCLLMAGCTGEGGELVAAPTQANRPLPIQTQGRLGALAYGVDGDIYVAESDGSNPVRIADGRPRKECGGNDEYWGEGPIWSPDGRYLAYRRWDCEVARDQWWDVVISDPKGNVVTSFPSEGWLISWSPDSTRVAVWVRWGETIGVFGLNGERQTLLTVPPEWMAPGDFDPVWSPDGESLLVPHGVVIPLDGSQPRKLPLAYGRFWNETYSPDGSHVAYGTDVYGPERSSLVVDAVDGSDPQVVFRGRFWGPVWSPTGDRIAFTSGHGTELRLLDVATGSVTLLTETDGSDMLSIMAGGGFKFSPEGDRILFSKTEDRGRGVSSLWSINADGSDPHRLVAGTAWGDW